MTEDYKAVSGVPKCAEHSCLWPWNFLWHRQLKVGTVYLGNIAICFLWSDGCLWQWPTQAKFWLGGPSAQATVAAHVPVWIGSVMVEDKWECCLLFSWLRQLKHKYKVSCSVGNRMGCGEEKKNNCSKKKKQHLPFAMFPVSSVDFHINKSF